MTSVTAFMADPAFTVRGFFRVVLVLVLLASWFGVGSAANERISDLSVKTAPKGEIIVSAKLLDAMEGKTINDIQHGIPKDLFYYVLLMRRQGGWFDEELLSRTVKYTVQYDVLKKRYLVHIRRDTDETNQMVENLQEATDLISKIDNVKITETKTLNPKETYYVRIKAQMRASRVPFYLKYLLFFIPVLELDTPWADTAPFYADTER
jgi:hypothetical protein